MVFIILGIAAAIAIALFVTNKKNETGGNSTGSKDRDSRQKRN